MYFYTVFLSRVHTSTPHSGLEQNSVLFSDCSIWWNRTVFYSAPESGTRRIRSQICMTHVPETGTRKMESIYDVGFWSIKVKVKVLYCF